MLTAAIPCNADTPDWYFVVSVVSFPPQLPVQKNTTDRRTERLNHSLVLAGVTRLQLATNGAARKSKRPLMSVSRCSAHWLNSSGWIPLFIFAQTLKSMLTLCICTVLIQETSGRDFSTVPYILPKLSIKGLAPRARLLLDAARVRALRFLGRCGKWSWKSLKRWKMNGFYDPWRPHWFRSIGGSVALWGEPSDGSAGIGGCLFFVCCSCKHNTPAVMFQLRFSRPCLIRSKEEQQGRHPGWTALWEGWEEKETSVRLVPVSHCDRSLSDKPVLSFARHDNDSCMSPFLARFIAVLLWT